MAYAVPPDLKPVSKQLLGSTKYYYDYHYDKIVGYKTRNWFIFEYKVPVYKRKKQRVYIDIKELICGRI